MLGFTSRTYASLGVRVVRGVTNRQKSNLLNEYAVHRRKPFGQVKHMNSTSTFIACFGVLVASISFARTIAKGITISLEPVQTREDRFVGYKENSDPIALRKLRLSRGSFPERTNCVA